MHTVRGWLRKPGRRTIRVAERPTRRQELDRFGGPFDSIQAHAFTNSTTKANTRGLSLTSVTDAYSEHGNRDVVQDAAHASG